MSGGGAAGFAHIGVLKALEENGIQIDYITGTSMGAIVGAFYAAGYTPDEMLELFSSDDFMKAVKGKYEEKYAYFLRQISDDPSWITLKLTLDSIETSIPGNLVSAHAVEMLLIKYLEPAAAAAHYDFNRLMIPFRCVAADITERTPIVFNQGNLSTAIRASSAYPLYFSPIEYQGHILFDGGIYDNFPISTMYNDFMPDFIIGSNVSYNYEKPTVDNPLSQIRSMIVKKSKYTVSCDVGENNVGIMIEPDLEDISTFDFDKINEAYQKGYEKALAYIDSIKQNVETVNPSKIEAKRLSFKQKLIPVIIDNIIIDGVNNAQKSYIKNALKIKYKKELSVDELIPEYFKLLSENRIRSIFPEVRFNPETNKYTLHLDITKEHNNILGFGGYFSNRPISEGFISLQYNFFDKLAYTLYANSYFGKLYNSTLLKFRIDFPWRLPFYWETGGLLSKWDYFKSSSNFFEDIKPSFLVQRNNFIFSELGFPVSNKGKLTFGTSYGLYDNQYFQTDNFTSTDTADFTDFTAYSPYVKLEYNSLNYPMYASKGSRFIASARFINGFEETIPGNTNPDTVSIFNNHEWLQFHLLYESYFNRAHKLNFGFMVEAYQSNQPFFQNYTASILSAPAFTPIAEAKTFFMPSYRAHSFAGGGVKLIYSITEKIQIRSEGYIFQPVNKILQDNLNKAYYGAEFSNRYYIWSNAAVFHSPFGPIAFNVNYYDGKKGEQFSFFFHIGYLLYNKNQFD